nr:hypothetical protein [Pandoravirus massiliensis]
MAFGVAAGRMRMAAHSLFSVCVFCALCARATSRRKQTDNKLTQKERTSKKNMMIDPNACLSFFLYFSRDGKAMASAQEKKAIHGLSLSPPCAYRAARLLSLSLSLLMSQTTWRGSFGTQRAL